MRCSLRVVRRSMFGDGRGQRSAAICSEIFKLDELVRFAGSAWDGGCFYMYCRKVI